MGILLETGRGVHLRRRSLFSILFLFWIFFWGELRSYFFFLELEWVVLGAVGTIGERGLVFEGGGRSLQSERERERERESFNLEGRNMSHADLSLSIFRQVRPMAIILFFEKGTGTFGLIIRNGFLWVEQILGKEGIRAANRGKRRQMEGIDC
jgi:hypothetical protein